MPPRVERQSRRVVDQPHGLNFVAAVKQLVEVGGQFAKHTAQVVVGLRRWPAPWAGISTARPRQNSL